MCPHVQGCVVCMLKQATVTHTTDRLKWVDRIGRWCNIQPVSISGCSSEREHHQDIGGGHRFNTCQPHQMTPSTHFALAVLFIVLEFYCIQRRRESHTACGSKWVVNRPSGRDGRTGEREDFTINN